MESHHFQEEDVQMEENELSSVSSVSSRSPQSVKKHVSKTARKTITTSSSVASQPVKKPLPGNDKRLRAASFTTYHITCLVNIFKRHKDVLLSDVRTSISEELKRSAWIEITRAMNARIPGRQWTTSQIKAKWKGLLSKARMDYYWVQDASRRREPVPDVGSHSEVIWEIYGSKIESSASSGSKVLIADANRQLEDSEQLMIQHSPLNASTPSAPVLKMAVAKKSAVSRSNSDQNLSYDYEQSPIRNGPGMVNGGQTTGGKYDQRVAKMSKQNSYDNSWRSSDNDVDVVDYMGDVRNGRRQFLASGKSDAMSTKLLRKNSLKDDVEDLESMRRRALKAEIALITLQNSMTESELEKLDMEKEKIALDKKKIELEMFLIRQKINSICTINDMS